MITVESRVSKSRPRASCGDFAAWLPMGLFLIKDESFGAKWLFLCIIGAIIRRTEIQVMNQMYLVPQKTIIPKILMIIDPMYSP
jgi:hypothetical protein